MLESCLYFLKKYLIKKYLSKNVFMKESFKNGADFYQSQLVL